MEKKYQTITGIVTKLCSSQTIQVSTKVTKVHPLYRKRYSLVRKYIAHDQNDGVKVGDTVTIIACRPISKLKHWTLLEK